jgi:hypothetical protein
VPDFRDAPVPFALGFQIYPWVERILKVRQHPLAAYGLALLMVALAVLVRGLVGRYVGVQVFTTFYPAIIIAALIGGLWPGVLATVLSAIAAWCLVIPSFFARPGQHELLEFVLFLVISAIDVAIAVLLNKLVDRLVTQQRAGAVEFLTKPLVPSSPSRSPACPHSLGVAWLTSVCVR